MVRERGRRSSRLAMKPCSSLTLCSLRDGRPLAAATRDKRLTLSANVDSGRRCPPLQGHGAASPMPPGQLADREKNKARFSSPREKKRDAQPLQQQFQVGARCC
ncbi:hypothetical protein MRX96_008261 [Rhipicephalus microplus]